MRDIVLLGTLATVIYFCWNRVEKFMGGGAMLSAKVVDKGDNFEVSNNGETYKLSKVCPHAGCNVDYNGENFVCPCHGSEFNIQGEVIHGPAKENLEKLD